MNCPYCNKDIVFLDAPHLNQCASKKFGKERESSLEQNPDWIREAAWDIEKQFFSGNMPCDDATCAMLAVDSTIRKHQPIERVSLNFWIKTMAEELQQLCDGDRLHYLEEKAIEILKRHIP